MDVFDVGGHGVVAREGLIGMIDGEPVRDGQPSSGNQEHRRVVLAFCEALGAVGRYRAGDTFDIPDQKIDEMVAKFG